MRKKSFLVFLVLLLLAALTTPFFVFGQEDETIITIAMQDWVAEALTPTVLADFEAQHPGVKVVINKVGDAAYYTPAAYSIEDHLDGAESYARSADVLYITEYSLSVETTRAGYFLDLAPLINADPNFNANDFFPAIWQSFQWDNGIWALPAGASITLLVYDKTAFDEAGLTYPTSTWTMDDLLNAARALTQKDEQGKITIPGFMSYSSTSLLRSVFGQGFYDPTTIPNPPMLTNPALVDILETWASWEAELGNDLGGYNYDDIPMAVDQTYRLYDYGINTEANAEWAASLLPGGKAGLSLNAFAVSAGTQHPELAYQLANFLTMQPEVINYFYGDFPARQSMVGVEAEETMVIRPEAPPEVQAIMDEAMANALPISELRYADYVNVALSQVSSPDSAIDPTTALENAENQALTALQTAEERRASAVIMVSTPVPTPVLAEGEISLKFGLTMYSSPLPNQDGWDQAMAEFIAIDPEVGHIQFDNSMGGMDDPVDVYECFFLPYSRSMEENMGNTVLNLDPFMDADPNFDRNDVIGTALSQLQYDNKTWGYPIMLLPSVIWYEPSLFEEAGVPLPPGTWSIETFVDALELLKASGNEEMSPFVPDYDNTYILMLTAAFGGLPIDIRVDPTVINFTDPTNLEALRQVLDLAKAGLIDYQELGNLSGGGSYGGPGLIPMTAETLYPGSWRFTYRSQIASEQAPAQLVAFPYGSQYTPVAYTVGAAYISAKAQHPEACYRWISYAAQKPELFTAMPAFWSQLESPALAATLGEDIVSFYRAYAASLQDPTAISFANNISTVNAWIEQQWFNVALDNYVLHEGNLDTDLADVEKIIGEFRECIAPIPPFNAADYVTEEEQLDYYRQFEDCAVSADPNYTRMIIDEDGS